MDSGWSIALALAVMAAVVAVVCAAAIFLRHGKKKTEDGENAVAEGSSSGIPAGREEEYQTGVAPCECGVPVMYTLHTCRHCVHLKKFLDAHGIEHRLVYVDDFTEPARGQLVAALRMYNPRLSFPTLVAPNGKSVIGFREAAVRQLLGIQ